MSFNSEVNGTSDDTKENTQIIIKTDINTLHNNTRGEVFCFYSSKFLASYFTWVPTLLLSGYYETSGL